MSIVRALALYEFQASAEVELTLKPGDIIVVKKKNAGDGWCEGELNGKRGLFPKGYVRLITFGKEGDDDDDDEETTDDSSAPVTFTGATPTSTASPTLMKPSNSTGKTPLTPMSTKKVFMETLLTPTPDTIKNVYNPDKVKELFLVDDAKPVAIGSGPTWKNRPPTLTIAVHDSLKGIRSSGVKMQKAYDVSTKELKVSVIRKFKHFLGLYDQLAEKFPCISLPPLPIKQSQLVTSGPGFVDTQKRGLERFLNRVAKHPVLGCARIFHLFLTAIDEKEWRIGTGKHTSLIRSGGTKTKKLLSAPIYHSVQYPPYNVPLNQLASFDKLSKFTGILDVNLSNMRKACETLKQMHGQMGSCLRSFGKDMQNLAEGADQPSLGARYRKPSQGVVSLPNSQLTTTLLPLTSTSPDETSDDETACDSVGEWNWREDETFTLMMGQLYDLGSCIRQMSQRAKRHQELLTKGVIEGLEEYSGIVHTLPVLVKLHEDAMAVYNESKQKASKTEAEDVRQDCETLNNILLAEFDYFSEQMTEDVQKLILSLMKAEADYHKRMAADWESMYTTYAQNKPIRRATIKRRTTLPGSQSVDETSSSSSTIPPAARPSSSDRNLNVSPSTVRRPYVNLTGFVPLIKKQGSHDNEHLYENVQILQSEKSSENTTPSHKSKEENAYENWKPKAKPVHQPLSPSNSLPLMQKPIPPPLVIKRHELMSNQSEAERIGNKTDSFIVPSLTHYSQISIGGSLELSGEKEDQIAEEEDEEWVQQKAKIEEMGRAIFNDSQQKSSNSSDTIHKTDSFDERRDTLTTNNVRGDVQAVDTSEKPTHSIEKGEDLVTKVSSSNKKDERSMTSSPNMSKLAQLTQLPGRKDGTSSPLEDNLPASSKSFSHYHHQSNHIPVHKVKSSKTLPKSKIPQSAKSLDYGQSELIRKLEKQRLRVDRQLSFDTSGNESTVGSSSGNASNITRSVDESLLKKVNDGGLSKFGIIEDKSGGSFIV